MPHSIEPNTTQRAIGWLIRDGYELTVVTHTPARPAGPLQ